MSEFEIRAFQGQGISRVIALHPSCTFQGTEPLTATVGGGDTQPADLTVTPTWVSGQTPGAFTLVTFSLTSAQTNTLTPRGYLVIISLADSTVTLATGELDIYSSPGGTPYPFWRSLTSPSIAQGFLPELTQEQLDTLPYALTAATRAMETYCQRPLCLDTYDHIVRPNGLIRFYLRNKPIVGVSRVSAQVVPGVEVTNTGTGTLSGATMTEVMASPQSMQIESLIFSTVASGVVTNQTLTMSDYLTFGDLATAINGLGNGWTGVAQDPWSSFPTADAFGTPGARSCLFQYIWIHTHSMPLGQWWFDADKGFVEINEPIPGGYLVPNPRVERTDTRYWGIRFTYRAGYAWQATDAALGYYTVPEDLQAACVMTANSIIEYIPTQGPVKSQTVKDRSYVLRDDLTVIPQAARIILAKYMRVVF